MKLAERINRSVQKAKFLSFKLGAELLKGNLIIAPLSGSLAFATSSFNPMYETRKVSNTMALGSLGIMFAILMILGIASAGLTIKGYMEGMQKAKQDQSGHPAIGGLQGMISTAGGAWIITFIVAYLFDTLTGGQLQNIVQAFITGATSSNGYGPGGY